MAALCQQSNSSYLMGWRHADEASKHSHWLTLIHVFHIDHSLWLAQIVTKLSPGLDDLNERL